MNCITVTRTLAAWAVLFGLAVATEPQTRETAIREVEGRLAVPSNHLLRGILRPNAEPRHDAPPVITTVAIQPQPVRQANSSAPNPQLLAAAGDDHTVRLWRLEDGKPVGKLKGHRDWVRSVVFTPDGRSLVTAGDDGRVLQWDLDGLALPPTELYKQDQTLYDVAVSPKGDRMFFVGFDAKLQTVALNSRRQGKQLVCPCGDMRTITVSPDGQQVASGGRDGLVHIWSLPDLQCRGEIQAHKRRVRAMTFNHDGRWLISAGEDRAIVVTSVGDGSEVMRLSSGPAKVLALAICGENVLASAGSDNLIRLWDLQKQTQLGTLAGHSGSVAALASNGETLVSGSFDTTVRVWRVRKAVDELQARLERESRSIR